MNAVDFSPPSPFIFLLTPYPLLITFKEEGMFFLLTDTSIFGKDKRFLPEVTSISLAIYKIQS